MNLTAEQMAAVNSGSPRVTVLAGAGTGKTSVLVARAERCEGSVLCLVFSRAAAAEIRRRLSPAARQRVEVHTFHSYAWSVLASDDLAIADHGMADRAMVSLYKGDPQFGAARPPRDQRQGIVALRSDVRRHEASGRGFPPIGMARTLLSRLSDQRRVPYWQLVPSVVARASLDTFDHVLVDEWQDATQNEKELATRSGGSLFVVGDPKQGIHRWRGADDWTTEGEVFSLTGSWRFTSAIANAANIIASAMKGLPAGTKPVVGLLGGEPGSVGRADVIGWKHAAGVVSIVIGRPKIRTIAVLCRTNFECEIVAGNLAEHGAHLVRRQGDDQLAAAEPDAPLQVMTLHASKGLEFDAVFVMTTDDWPTTTPSEDELRVCYVGATRARRLLMVVSVVC